jgi:hypothetical protein
MTIGFRADRLSRASPLVSFNGSAGWFKQTNGSRIMLTALRATKVQMLAAVFLMACPAIADAQTTGSVRITVQNVGFIVGVGGGSGTLRFRGRTYPLRVDGLGVGTIGIARADLVGTARNLRNATDIVGTYTAVGAGVAIAGGARGVTLQNSKGVVLSLQGRQAGFSASLGVGGVTVSMR